jgi:hypothetical protein
VALCRLGSCAHFHVEQELRNAAESDQDVQCEVPVAGRSGMQQATRRVVLLGACQRGKPEQRQQDVCAGGIEACRCRACRERVRAAARVDVS